MKRKWLLFIVTLISALFVGGLAAWAHEGESIEEVLQDGWVQIGEQRYENPKTGEYFYVISDNSRSSTTSLSFEFKIRNSFKCPTKFKASASSADISAFAQIVESNGMVIAGATEVNYVFDIGSKHKTFETGSNSDGTVSGLNKGSEYTVYVSTDKNKLPSNGYVSGNVTIE